MAVEIELTRDRQIEELVREIGHVIDDAQPGTANHSSKWRPISWTQETQRFSITDRRDISGGAEHVALSVLVADSGHEFILFCPGLVGADWAPAL